VRVSGIERGQQDGHGLGVRRKAPILRGVQYLGTALFGVSSFFRVAKITITPNNEQKLVQMIAVFSIVDTINKKQTHNPPTSPFQLHGILLQSWIWYVIDVGVSNQFMESNMRQAESPFEAHFRVAPWPGILTGISLFVTILLCGVSYAVYKAFPPRGVAHLFGLLVAFIPFLIAPLPALFMVRGYELDGTNLRIKRLLWYTVIPLVGISQMTRVPLLLKDTRRVVGNGGLFSFTGRYRHPRHGNYRAFITDWKRSVVLKMPDATIAVSPEDPNQFMAALRNRFTAL